MNNFRKSLFRLKFRYFFKGQVYVIIYMTTVNHEADGFHLDF